MTRNHDYNTPKKGQQDWNTPLNDNFAQLDTDVEIRDREANRDQYEPKKNAKFFSVDSGNVYIGDGNNWNAVSASTSSRNPSFGTLSADVIKHTPDTTSVNYQQVSRDLVSTDHVDIYVDPDAGSPDASGSQNDPVDSLTEALTRLPFIIQHRVTIHLADGTYDANDYTTINSGMHWVTFQQDMDGVQEPFSIVGDTNNPSNVKLSNTSFVNVAFHGHVPWNTTLKGIEFYGMLQNYGGRMRVKDCVFNARNFDVHAVDGYGGFTMLKNCQIDGYEHAGYANQNHQIFFEDCNGSVRSSSPYSSNVFGEVRQRGSSFSTS